MYNNPELDDMKISMPLKEDPKKEIHTGKFMTGKEDQSFPTGGCPTDKPFVGAEGTETLEEWMDGKRTPAQPTAETLPWMGRK